MLKLEETFRQLVPKGAYGFIINLADGTAVVHPNIKQTHEVMNLLPVSLPSHSSSFVKSCSVATVFFFMVVLPILMIMM
jgi:hypothetical protein